MTTAPTVHLNGTSRDALLKQVRNAGNALRKAIDAMHEAAPNARDYYPQGPDAFGRAQRAHSLRIQRASELLHEYQDIAEAIAG